MSYTTFDVATENAAWKPDAEPKTIAVTVKVTNTGSCAGKEVVQIYAACPFGKLKKERKRLVAFGKTALLQPGESETLHLKVPTVLLESYRTGKAVYCMEAGDYDFLVGTSSRDVTLAARLTLDKTVETEHLTNICPLLDALKEIQPEEEKEERWRAEREQMWEEKEAEIPLLFLDEKGLIHDGKSAEEMYKILKFGKTNAAEAKECDANGFEFEAETTEAKEDAGNCRCGAGQAKWEERRREAMEKAAELVQKLTPEEKTALVCGRSSSGNKEIIGAAAVTVPGAAGETTASLLEKYGVANVILADGPAGIRITSHYQKNPSDGSVYKMNMYQRLENRIFGTEFLHTDGEDYYQYCSAIPVGTLLAQTFDTELLEEVGRMIGAELEEFGVTLWLAPGMNIHRNPLCGRNFEYFSEDPLLAGKCCAADVRGIQSQKIAASVKHFACNNRESNRFECDSRVSERALREVYLRGFEICVREADPWTIMSSYNLINGSHTSVSYELLTELLRNEWGFRGAVTTDWGVHSSHSDEVLAGNDIKMGDGEPEELKAAFESGKITRADLEVSVKRILELTLKLAQ